MVNFDPNAAAPSDSGIFGLPYTQEDSKLVLIPVPWEATTSYGGGTSQGPQAILEASHQLDLFDRELDSPYKIGIAMLDPCQEISKWNKQAKSLAQPIIKNGGVNNKPKLSANLNKVNQLSEKVNNFVEQETYRLLNSDKIVGIVGGDHSVPLGAFAAASKKFGSFGILHFDAHSDTRLAYEGFTYSHASIMRNALDRIPNISKITQVGIRDFCQEEFEYTQSMGDRVDVFYDGAIQKQKIEGISWSSIAKSIIDSLPAKVWISFDIDGLDPKLCPNTGTPVPGGLSFAEAEYLIKQLALSGKTIIGFDLNEVSPGLNDEWDANVGMRMLYKMCVWTAYSQKLVTLR